jgi:transcription antitermination factor NusG
MPFIIHTLNGKEKLVEAVLRKNGLDPKISPLKEFVICQDAPPSFVNDMPQVLKIMEATSEEIECLLNDEPKEKDDNTVITAGALVEITHGSYEGFKGLVHEVKDKEVIVDVSVFGKALPVSVGIEEIKMVNIGEQWG